MLKKTGAPGPKKLCILWVTGVGINKQLYSATFVHIFQEACSYSLVYILLVPCCNSNRKSDILDRKCNFDLILIFFRSSILTNSS